MSARAKKRKLPADLCEAETLVKSSKSGRSMVVDAHRLLQSVDLKEVEGVPNAQPLSPNETTSWLIAKYGIAEIQTLSTILTT